MGFLDRLGRLFRANFNDFLNKAEDPAKILDQSVVDMQSDLERLRKAVATAMASQQRLGKQAEHAENQSNVWYQRAEQAIEKGEEDLAREALIRRRTFQGTFSTLSNQLEGEAGQVEILKRSLIALENKIAEARTKKEMLKARAQAAQAQQQLQNAVGSIDSNSSMAAFERMEDKVEALEASSKILGELAEDDLEKKFASLESSNDIEDELAELRKNLNRPSNQAALPEGNDSISNQENLLPEVEAVEIAEVENDLDELKRSIDNK